MVSLVFPENHLIRNGPVHGVPISRFRLKVKSPKFLQNRLCIRTETLSCNNPNLRVVDKTPASWNSASNTLNKPFGDACRLQ